MDTSVGSPALARFTALLSNRLGLSLEQEPEGRIAKLLAERTARTGARDEESYLARLENPLWARAEFSKLADELAVRESFFFRNKGVFDAIAGHVLADLDATRPPGRPLRFLSAGCAAGEEPYSLAMLVRESALMERRPVVIEAFDASARLITHARRGVFSEWSFRELSSERRERWFDKVDSRHWRLDRSIVDSVEFSVRNLLTPDPSYWEPGRFDLILCRNVLIYFTPAAIRQSVDRLTHSLAPGGYLFLGHAETLHGRGKGLRLHHSHGVFYYQCEDAKRRQPPARPTLSRSHFSESPSSDPEAETEQEERDGWSRRIHDFTARIEALLPSRRRQRERTPSGMGDDSVRSGADSLLNSRNGQLKDSTSGHRSAERFNGPVEPGSPSTERLDTVVDLVREERFGEALELTLPDPTASSTATSTERALRVARAAILLSMGEEEAAARLCRELLAEDELDSTVRYIDGIRRTNAGDEAGARDQLRAAAFLDPRFALPRLQLGILAHRKGDAAEARRELEHAVRLLPEERSRRVALLGGGLDRNGLTQVALRELRALEGGR